MALGWLWRRAWSSGGAVAPRRFAWQAWHFVTSTFTLRGRRGTSPHPPALCVAGVALDDIHLHFVWQAWHLTTSIVTLRGRRGTYGTGLALAPRLVIRWRRVAAAFCVAGVTSTFTLRGRRGTSRHPPSLCVAGVALDDIHLHFVCRRGT